MTRKLSCCSIITLCLLVAAGYAQGTLADYERANGLREKYVGLATNLPERANWIGQTSRFWYRKAVKGGNEFVLMDAETLAKKPAFDHERLAAALSAAASEKYTALKLPFVQINFVDNEKAIEFSIQDARGETRWRCELADYTVKRLPPDGPGVFGQRGAGGIPLNRGIPGPRYNSTQTEAKASPDGKWEAWVNNFNVWVRPKGKPSSISSSISSSRPNGNSAGVALSFDGSEGNYYALASLAWSPDSQKIAAYRVRPGYARKIQYVESSPADQLQPKYFTMDYAKPGDELDTPQPVLFHVESKKQIVIENSLFPNPYQNSRIEWRKDSLAFTFEYNQRGHQVYRIIEVDAASPATMGKPRAVISEEPKTFFCYSGKKYRSDIADGKEIIWMSERDGWNHLYLFDGATGAVKNQITKGQWVVRGVEKVDDAKRQIWFQASGMVPGKDPYFVHYYRINFDGTGLTALTEGDGNHIVSFSPDQKYYVDTWSRVDQPTISELRLTADKKILTEVERSDIAELTQAGWRAPEVFTSMGRDGKTEIWGVIYRPSNFSPLKKYPVVENIYAGPQGSFVPKVFTPWNPMQSLAELGFIVVQIDGMGTANRSKAFHDVAWKNLGDAGFPDRILWHKAVAAKYPYYD
ncbi:MAG: S9 family peptidase, partial [Acidobacteriota bacterium]|nr:S9 family peptidase [Acidobacteriota bacterium]